MSFAFVRPFRVKVTSPVVASVALVGKSVIPVQKLIFEEKKLSISVVFFLLTGFCIETLYLYFFICVDVDTSLGLYRLNRVCWCCIVCK